MPDDIVKLFDPELIRSTEKAHLLKVHLENNLTEEIWFPKSQCSIAENLDGSIYQPLEIYIEKWFLEQKQKIIGEYILHE